jgi:hypothetical protein
MRENLILATRSQPPPQTPKEKKTPIISYLVCSSKALKYVKFSGPKQRFIDESIEFDYFKSSKISNWGHLATRATLTPALTWNHNILRINSQKLKAFRKRKDRANSVQHQIGLYPITLMAPPYRPHLGHYSK